MLGYSTALVSSVISFRMRNRLKTEVEVNNKFCLRGNVITLAKYKAVSLILPTAGCTNSFTDFVSFNLTLDNLMTLLINEVSRNRINDSRISSENPAGTKNKKALNIISVTQESYSINNLALSVSAAPNNLTTYNPLASP